MMNKRNDFQQLVDRDLSKLQWDEGRKRKVLRALDKEGGFVMKKWTVAAALMLCLCLMSGAAYATYILNYSPEATARKTAVAALEEKYGLDAACLGLFFSRTLENERGLWVCYTAGPELPFELAGYYNALVKGGAATVTWSNDDIDPALWQSGDLDAPAWGAPQLKNLLAAAPAVRHLLVEPYMERGSENKQFASYTYSPVALPTVIPTVMPTAAPTQNVEDRQVNWPIDLPTGRVYAAIVSPEEGDISLDEARILAVTAFVDIYGLTVEQQAQAKYNYSNQLVEYEGQRIWVVGMFLNGGDICFTGLVDAQTGLLIDTYIHTGGNG